MLPLKLIEAATLFFSKGMKLVPVNGKVPQLKDWPNRAVESIETFMALVNAQTTGAALLCGPHSGVYVLDIDPRNEGFHGLQLLEEKFGKLPETVIVETGGGGLHLYFRCSEPIEKRPALFRGVDGQFKNSLVVIPGSLHSSGNSYYFKDGFGLGDIAIADLPPTIVNFLRSKEPSTAQTTVNLNALNVIKEGGRNGGLFKVGLEILKRDGDPNGLFYSLMETNGKICIPPLSKSEVEKIAKSCLKYTKDFYAVKDGCLTKAGERLCNFDMQIATEIVRDDGVSRDVSFELTGTYSSGESVGSIQVSTADFFSGDFLRKIGRKAIPVVGPFNRDHIRAAIQTLSTETKLRTIFTHTGFRELDGRRVFLHTGGALGSDGNDSSVEVEMPTALLRSYELELSESEALLGIYVKHILELINLGPSYITIPLVAISFRAPLAHWMPITFVTFLTGRTGTFKSVLFGLSMSFFGRSFNHQKLPGSFESTANAIEKQSFMLKDVLGGLDDLAPDGTLFDIQAKSKVVSRIVRTIGNGEGAGRARLNSDSTFKGSYFPRGANAMTAEDVPKGASTRARMGIIPFNVDDIDKANLTRIQEFAANGEFVKVMGSYISWLCCKPDEFFEDIPKELVRFRDKVATGGGHLRTPDSIANYALGFQMFLRFARERGAITVAESDLHMSNAWNALKTLEELQRPYLATEDPSANFVEYLRAAFTLGKAYLSDYQSGKTAPMNRPALGWFHDLSGNGLVPKGLKIGWVDVASDEVMLEPNAAFTIAQEMARSQGNSINLTKEVLWKRLAEGGWIKTSQAEGKNMLKRSPADHDRKRVLVFPVIANFLVPDMDDEERDQLKAVSPEKRSETHHAH